MLPRLAAAIAFFIAVLAGQVLADTPRILVLGDSFMTTNGARETSVVHELGRLTGAKVRSQAVTGARFG